MGSVERSGVIRQRIVIVHEVQIEGSMSRKLIALYIPSNRLSNMNENMFMIFYVF